MIEIQSIEVQYKVEDTPLRGHLHLPATPRSEARPGIVLIPGFADTAVGPHNLHVALARRLAQTGYVVMRFDYRGQGESEGDFRHFTAQSGLDDARAALKLLRSHSEVDPQRLGVVGYSLGGTLACLLAAEVAEIRSLVLLAPVAYPSQVFHSFFTDQQRAQGAQQGWIDWLGWSVGQRFLAGLPAITPLAMLRQSHADTLVLHGTADSEVSPENARAFEAQGARVQWLEGIDHQFASVLAQDTILHSVSDWFQTHRL